MILRKKTLYLRYSTTTNFNTEYYEERFPVGMNIDTDKPLLVLIFVLVQLLSTSLVTNTGGNDTGNDFDPFNVPGSDGNDIDFLPKIFIPYYLVNGTAIHNLITATLLEMNPSMGSNSCDNNTIFAATAFQLLIMNGNIVKVITTAYSSKNGLINKKGNNIWSDDADIID